jgi:hypothetical protein
LTFANGTRLLAIASKEPGSAKNARWELSLAFCVGAYTIKVRGCAHRFG